MPSFFQERKESDSSPRLLTRLLVPNLHLCFPSPNHPCLSSTWCTRRPIIISYSKSPSKLSLKPSAIKPSPKSKPKGFPIKNATSTAPSSIGASSTAASSTSTNPVIDGSGPNLTSGLPIPSSLPPEAALQMQKLMEQGGRGHPRDMAMGSMGQVSPNVTAAGVAPQPSPQGMQGMMPRQGKSGPQPQMGGVVGGRRKKIEYGYDTVIHAS
ncbi:hypothetical protein F5879DRAFT_960798, partial [Lentinula edodes]